MTKNKNAANAARMSEYLNFDPESIYLRNYCPVAVLKGSWREMGAQYARQYPDIIKRNIADKLAEALRARKSIEEIYAALPQCEDDLSFFPAYLDFCRGMSEGLGMDYRDVLVSMVRLNEPVYACAAASAWGSATPDGKVYSAIHSDSPYVSVYLQPAILALPDEGNAFISFTGFTNAFMNSKGLSSLSTFGPVDAPTKCKKALPASVGNLYCAVYCDDVEQALKAHTTYCRSGGFGGEIVQYTDSSGNAAVLEATGDGYGIRRAGDFGERDFICQTNCFKTPSMRNKAGDIPKNLIRYNSIFKRLDERCGAISMDELKNALANTSYFDPESESWVYEWKLETGLWSPERKDPLQGPAMRRVFDLKEKDAYILMGAQDDIVSKVPEALGSYAKISLRADLNETAELSLAESRLQLWKAMRDVDGARRAGKVTEKRMDYLNEAKRAVYQALGYKALAEIGASTDEKCEFYGKCLSTLNKCQCYAKAASDEPHSIL